MPKTVTEPDLNETDDVILVELSHGRNVPTNLADVADKSRQYVHQRLKILETADYVRNVGNGVYELQPGEIPGGELDRLEITTEDVSDLRTRLQDALEARDDAQARADRLADELEDCRAQLEDCQDRLGDRADLAAVERALDDVEAAAERGNGDTLKDALERARVAIGDA